MIIYCIEDINDLKYVGKTKQKLNDRLTGHRASKKNKGDCIIYPLEECEEDLSKEREKYWINKLDTINKFKLIGENKENRKKRNKQRYCENKDYYDNNNKSYYEKNKEILKAKRRERYRKNNDM